MLLFSIVSLLLCSFHSTESEMNELVDECNCVPFYLCGVDSDTMNSTKASEGNCSEPLEVCCSKEDMLTTRYSDGIENYFNMNKKESISCQCVPPRFCKNEIIIDVSDLFDAENGIMYKFPGVCYCNKDQHKCDDYIEVCCVPPEKAITSIGNDFRRRIGCGQRNTDNIGSKYKDEETESQFGDFPWTALVISKEDVGTGDILNVFLCGGALIHEGAIITAAHCVYDQKNKTFMARAGEWDTQTRYEIINHQDRMVKKIIIHENFNPVFLHNNIAILVLVEPFKLDDNVDTICLPKQGKVSTSGECFLTGWGKDVNKGKYQVIMKKLEQTMVDRSTCQSQLQNTTLGSNFTLHKSFVCAKGTNKNQSCKGDGGSPLVCPIPGREFLYEQVGIGSWGIECNNGTPAVFTNVAEYSDWIDYHLKVIQLASENEDVQESANISSLKYK